MKKAFITMILLIVCCATISAKPVKVILFYPNTEEFWDRFVLFAEEACTDLNMEIKSVNGNDNHVQMLKDLGNFIKNDKPDIVVFNNFKNIAPEMIEMTNKAKISSFLINSDLSPEMKKKMGEPRKLYPFWIGQMIPGEEEAGIKIAEMLFKKAKSIVAINGVFETGAAIMREAALKKAMLNKSIDLKQVFYTNKWERVPSAERTEVALKRYPKIQGVWSANGSLALGVVDAVEKAKLTPGKDIFVTGYDIPAEVLENIKNGKILASAGGHFIEGAWAMVLIHDYFNGIKIDTKMQTPMAVITKDNADLYLKKLTDAKINKENLKKIDFKLYSKKYNGGKPYNFSLDNVLKQL